MKKDDREVRLTMNHFLVGSNGVEVGVLNPPLRPLSRPEAMNLAAWLLAVAGAEDDEFSELLNEVRSL